MNENKFNDHKNKNKNYNNSNNLSDKKYNNDNNNYNDDDIIEENQNSDNDKAYINNEVHTFNESGNGNANNETQVTKIQQLIEEYDDQENDISKILDSQKKKSANERCYLLYNKGKIKNEVNRLMFKKNSELKEKDFLAFILKVFKDLSKEESLSFKERKTITGKRFLLTALPDVLPFKTFINLDFSFREKILEPQKSTLKMEDYPLIFTSYLYHPSKEEIFAEKIRAVMTRKKGRDLYDLWYLLALGVSLKADLVEEKLKYYNLKDINQERILKRIENFSEKEFIIDLRPLVSLPEREKLPDLLKYIKDYLKEHLDGSS